MFYEIVHHAFCPPLRQPLVVFGRAFVVAVGTQLNGDVRILVEQRDKLVESLL